MDKVADNDLALSFGTSAEDIAEKCGALIEKINLKYNVINGEERDKLIVNILKKIDGDRQVIGAKERREVWDKGWAENLSDFSANSHDLDKLIPKFIRPNQPVRFNRQYIMPSNPNFELDFVRIFRQWLFLTYFAEVKNVYEFGCGTGFNLVALAQLFPDKKIYGLDFVRSSCDLVNKIAQVYKWNISGSIFDMINPDYAFKLSPDSAVFTIGAIEQLAGKVDAFLDYLLKARPVICVNVEPTLDLYDEDNLVDWLAAKFHRKRGYTDNLLSQLKELEKAGKVEIIKVKRSFFGSLYMEGFTYIVWKVR